MKNVEYRLFAAALCLAAAPLSSSTAEAGVTQQVKFSAAARLEPTKVLVLGSERRANADQFAARQKLDAGALKQSHAASGLIQCGRAHGAGQLTLANNVITTAAHVFYDERGAKRARSCQFVTEVEGKKRRIAVDMSSIVAGSAKPYAVKAINDWAVARLTQPLDDVKPYGLADQIAVEQTVEFVSRGHSDWRDAETMSFESCRLRAQTNQLKGGAREFAFDCGTGDGASGGAVLAGERHADLGAILVGWRSNDPSHVGPYSTTNYNFVVSVEGVFRQAVLAAAGQDAPPATASAAPAGDKAAAERDQRRSAGRD
ncbi:trypsin-like serine protease [Methylosinus sporium]|uniref:Trypsin-like serine protease n=1 Tax=Methylosinus sporium TaxID=428 RepID=A0A549SU36_METSR|nr:MULTISPECIES: trypsin-like serine protease [Methylosinus]MBU3889101.1 trypsin-like serine protease [Methylosinus sp. KRF6]TRL33077.1 trypsin-like serine protease [Methylosinus sporium]